MESVHKILEVTTLEEAKAIAFSYLENHNSKVQKENIRKAELMIDRCSSIQNVAFGMSNFILSFLGEKVIK